MYVYKEGRKPNDVEIQMSLGSPWMFLFDVTHLNILDLKQKQGPYDRP